MIKIDYDKQGDILGIKFNDDSIVDSEYIEENGIVVDFNQNGKIVGIEITSFSKRTGNIPEISALAV